MSNSKLVSVDQFKFEANTVYQVCVAVSNFKEKTRLKEGTIK